MTFNPVTWNSTQPITTQNISTGQATIKNNFDFFSNATGNTSPSGFIQMPSGLIFQWGKTGTLNVGNLAYSFVRDWGMKSFPSACYAIYFQPISTSPNGKVPICVSTGTLTNTGVSLSIATGSSYTGGAYVFAIGI